MRGTGKTKQWNQHEKHQNKLRPAQQIKVLALVCGFMSQASIDIVA